MDATLLVAVTGFIVGVGGLVLNLRGQRDQNRQQRAANAVLEDKGRLDETQQALDATERRAERAEAGEERWRERAATLEDALDEQKQLYRSMYAAQESRCREVTGDLVDTLLGLRGVVRDEVTRAATDAALESFTPHPHELPAPGPHEDQQP